MPGSAQADMLAHANVTMNAYYNDAGQIVLGYITATAPICDPVLREELSNIKGVQGREYFLDSLQHRFRNVILGYYPTSGITHG